MGWIFKLKGKLKFFLFFFFNGKRDIRTKVICIHKTMYYVQEKKKRKKKLQSDRITLSQFLNIIFIYQYHFYCFSS